MPDSTPEKKPDDLLDYKAIGILLDAHPKTVARWDRDGLLPRPSFQVGGFRKWRRDIIAAWIFIGGSRTRRRKKRRESPDVPPVGSKRERKSPSG